MLSYPSSLVLQRKKLKILVWGEDCIYGPDGHLGVFLADINAVAIVASKGKQLKGLIFSVFIFKNGNIFLVGFE